VSVGQRINEEVLEIAVIAGPAEDQPGASHSQILRPFPQHTFFFSGLSRARLWLM
jgi:hypothetical protein